MIITRTCTGMAITLIPMPTGMAAKRMAIATTLSLRPAWIAFSAK